MIKYCTAVALVTLTLSTLDAGLLDADELTVPQNRSQMRIAKYKQQINLEELTQQNPSTLQDNDLKRVEEHLSWRRSNQRQKWNDRHEREICCGLTCSGFIPAAIGMWFDGLEVAMAKKIDPENPPVGSVAGLAIGVAAMTAFARWYQAPETETSETLAEVRQERAKRKEKAD